MPAGGGGSYAATMLDAAVAAYSGGKTEAAEALLRLVFGGSGCDGYLMYFIGHLNHVRGRFDDALTCLSTALELAPDNPLVHQDLGETCRAMGRQEEAVAHLERAIALEPTLGGAYASLAEALLALNRPEQALRIAQEALWRAGNRAPAHCLLGRVLTRLNRAEDALHQFAQALALQPGCAEARRGSSLVRLSLGQWPEGWDGYTARAGRSAMIRHGRLWSGETAIGGRRLLLHAEAGFADTLQFVRYAPQLAQRGARVVLQVPPTLLSLLADLPHVESVHATDEGVPRCDLHCPLPDLPAAFRTGLADIPAAIPYLRPADLRVDAWQERLGPWRRMRVGIAWSGDPAAADDLARSLPLGRLEPLLTRDDIECHIIQRDIRAADRSVLQDFPQVRDWSEALSDWAETAALVSQLDLVIAADTAPAHLAGALGKPVWLMLGVSADWRWLRERADSPWYPTMRLFRQVKRDDWAAVVAMLAQQLDQWRKASH